MAGCRPRSRASTTSSEQAGAVEREQVLLAAWTCVGRLDQLGLAAPGSGRVLPGRRAVVDLLGESVAADRRRKDGALHALFNVCRHRGSQVVPVDPRRAPPAPCDAKSLRCPYHSWTYDLDGRLLRAPHTEDVDDFDPADVRAAPGRRRRVGRLRLWSTSRPSAEPSLADELGAGPRAASGATRSTRSSSAAG